jgi:hypothetical protein
LDAAIFLQFPRDLAFTLSIPSFADRHIPEGVSEQARL